MKKAFLAIAALGAVAAFGQAAGTDLVYDLKISYKRLDPYFHSTKLNGEKAPIEHYKVANDLMTGYLVIPKCLTCSIEDAEADHYAWNQMDDDLKPGLVYLNRRGDKWSYKEGVATIIKANAKAGAAIFGAYVDLNEATGEPLPSITNSKDAWMYVAFGAEDADTNYRPNVVVAAKISTSYGVIAIDAQNGFLGYDSYDAFVVENAGFGKANVIRSAIVCKGSSTCVAINNISGSTIGAGYWGGPCNVTPMWDLCYDDELVPENVNKAIISGSFTVKYNSNLTNKVLNLENARAKELAILYTFSKATYTDMFGLEAAEDELADLVPASAM